jgi:hypothetical protein
MNGAEECAVAVSDWAWEQACNEARSVMMVTDTFCIAADWIRQRAMDIARTQPYGPGEPRLADNP